MGTADSPRLKTLRRVQVCGELIAGLAVVAYIVMAVVKLIH
jgi:hypothetical protein